MWMVWWGLLGRRRIRRRGFVLAPWLQYNVVWRWLDCVEIELQWWCTLMCSKFMNDQFARLCSVVLLQQRMIAKEMRSYCMQSIETTSWFMVVVGCHREGGGSWVRVVFVLQNGWESFQKRIWRGLSEEYPRPRLLSLWPKRCCLAITNMVDSKTVSPNT